MNNIRRGEIALLLLDKMLVDGGVRGLRDLYTNVGIIAKQHDIPITEAMEFAEVIKLQAINQIRGRTTTEATVTDPLDEIADKEVERRSSRRGRSMSNAQMSFQEFEALCSELFTDSHSFKDESGTRPGAYRTVYTATIRAMNTDLKLTVSHPEPGCAGVNIFVQPHLVDAIINAGPAEAKLREFAKQLLSE